MANLNTEADVVEYVNRSLTNQPPTSDTIVTWMESLRFYAKNYARAIIAYSPPSRERDIAIERMEDSVMWAIKGIALHQEAALNLKH